MVDVTIRGAGIIGLTLAWVCVQRGAKVCVIDPFGPGAGSSGGLVGALAPHVPENWNQKKAFQLESLLMAEVFWQEVEAASGLSTGYGRFGRVQPLPDARAVELARQRTHTSLELWQGKAHWTVTDAPRLGQWQPRSASGYYVYDTLSARLHPRRACNALAAAVEAKGGRIAKAAEDVGHVVHCSGWHGLKDLNAAFERPLGNGVKGQAALLDCRAVDMPQLFVGGLHVVPHSDGTVAIGSTSERDFDQATSTDTQLDQLIDTARQSVPALRDAPVLERWAGVRPRSKSRAPVMGRWPGRTGHFISNGGFKIGFGMAPGMARVMADLVLDGQDVIPDDFRFEHLLSG
jgi:glycine/D-amino acid oxidase-like deaminating enzyme